MAKYWIEGLENRYYYNEEEDTVYSTIKNQDGKKVYKKMNVGGSEYYELWTIKNNEKIKVIYEHNHIKEHLGEEIVNVKENLILKYLTPDSELIKELERRGYKCEKV